MGDPEVTGVGTGDGSRGVAGVPAHLSMATIDGVPVTDAVAPGTAGLLLKRRMQRQPALLAPGAYDALSALMIKQAGFEAMFISGSGISYSQMARPDIGLISLDQLCQVTRRVRDRLNTPLIVDADNGFGDATNVEHTVRLLERAGASAVLIDDQTFPKRAGALSGKTFVTPAMMAEKVQAAVNARAQSTTLVIARTDALPHEGIEAALARASLYKDAGADALFIDQPQSLDDYQRIAATFPDIPLVANMIEGGSSPALTAGQLSALGYGLVISSGSLVRGFAAMAERLLQVLKRDGSTAALADEMLSFSALNERLGLADIADKGRRFDPAFKLETLMASQARDVE